MLILGRGVLHTERGDRKLCERLKWNKKRKNQIRSNSAVGGVELIDAGNVVQDEITPCQTNWTVCQRRVIEGNKDV